MVRILALTAEGSIPGWGTEIPRAAWCSKKKKKKKGSIAAVVNSMDCSWFKAVSDIYCVTLGMSLIAYGERCQIHDLQRRFSLHSSVGEESACSAGDPGSIPGLGRSAGEGISYPLQYSQASLVAQLVKNLPAMRETRV